MLDAYSHELCGIAIHGRKVDAMLADPRFELSMGCDSRLMTLFQKLLAQCDVGLHVATRPNCKADNCQRFCWLEVNEGCKRVVENEWDTVMVGGTDDVRYIDTWFICGDFRAC